MLGQTAHIFCLVFFLSGVKAFTSTIQADGLRHWGNSYFDVARTRKVEEGSPLALVCSTPDQFGSCSFDGPIGQYYVVNGDSVVDGNGDAVDGVSAWSGNNATVCGIVLDQYAYEQHWETWRCNREHDGEFAYISLSGEVSSNLRLAKDVTPLRYDVVLSPDYSSNFMSNGDAPIKFSGSVNITTKLSSAKDCISLQFDEMNILNTVITSGGESFFLAKDGFDFQRTFYEVCLKGGFQADISYLIGIDFDVDVIRGGYYQYGFYYQPCSPGSDKACWFTQGESTNNRNIFPCFDEPALKAPVSVQVAQPPEGFRVLSNMPETLGQTNENWIEFEETPDMSVYLFALAITDYVAQNSSDPNVNVWCSNEDYMAGRCIFGADIGARILNFYGEIFDVPYSLPKMDLVNENGKYGAMENWGLILFAPVTILLDQDLIDVEGPEESRWIVSSVVAHELAHQWFGNLVTLDWWNQMWLNEGFATWVSYLGADLVDPDNLVWARLLLEETFPVMEDDSNTNVHWALTDTVTTRPDIDRMFGSFSYSKGGSFLRMIDSFLGHQVFLDGLTSYLNMFSFSSATEDDLFFHLTAAATEAGTWPGTYTGSASLADILRGWTNQAGYPLVTANLDCPSQESCKLRLSQKWFVTKGQTGDEERLWTIPVTVVFPSGESVLYWLESADLELDVADKYDPSSEKPIILNDNATGYFRVNYDDNNWARIGKVLEEDVESISLFSRLQVACDLPWLRSHGDLSEEVYRDIVQGWQEEDVAGGWALDQCIRGTRQPTNTHKYKHRR